MIKIFKVTKEEGYIKSPLFTQPVEYEWEPLEVDFFVDQDVANKFIENAEKMHNVLCHSRYPKVRWVCEPIEAESVAWVTKIEFVSGMSGQLHDVDFGTISFSSEKSAKEYIIEELSKRFEDDGILYKHKLRDVYYRARKSDEFDLESSLRTKYIGTISLSPIFS